MHIESIERALGHHFRTREFLRQALTHRSHDASHNERLEFLGDSLLNCVVAELLFQRYPALREGDLSRLRASLVRQQTLFELAQRLDLGAHLLLGEGELKSGGSRRPSILADAFEAVLAAIYLDAGFEPMRAVITRLFEPLLATIDPNGAAKDPKTALQEALQARRLALPQYVLRATHGAEHAQMFEVQCEIPTLQISTVGTGASRRIAEQEAARHAFELMSAAAGQR
jgi:ribonuclease-3